MADPADAFWESLKWLLCDPGIGAATKLCFAHLWKLAGCKPEHIVISPMQVAAALGRSRRALRSWIDELVAADLVRIIEKDERRGRWQLYVMHPNPARRERPPDPQKYLPLGPPDGEVPAPKPPSKPAGGEVSAPKPPRPDSQNLAAFPVAEVTAHKPPTQNRKPEVFAPKSPPKPPEDDRTRGVCAQKPPTTPTESAGKPHARALDVDRRVDWSTSTSTSTDDQGRAEETADETTESEVWLAAVGAAFRWIDRYPMLLPQHRDPGNRSLFLKACYLAETEFGEHWLRDSLEAVKHIGPRNPWAYLHACLANKAGLSPEEFKRRLRPIVLTVADEMIRLRNAMQARAP